MRLKSSLEYYIHFSECLVSKRLEVAQTRERFFHAEDRIFRGKLSFESEKRRFYSFENCWIVKFIPHSLFTRLRYLWKFVFPYLHYLTRSNLNRKIFCPLHIALSIFRNIYFCVVCAFYARLYLQIFHKRINILQPSHQFPKRLYSANKIIILHAWFRSALNWRSVTTISASKRAITASILILSRRLPPGRELVNASDTEFRVTTGSCHRDGTPAAIS